MRLSLIFGLCWIAWCAFSILWLGPKIASHHLNDHRALIAWILCVIPLILYAIVLVRASKTQSRS
jgi:membrane protein DedA with SNARE-associated domain